MEKIGFIGLGIMGQGMANRLLDAGYTVVVWNRTCDKAAEIAGKGALVADTPKQAADGADIVITMLADPLAIEDVVMRQGGVIEGLKEGAILVDCSTVDPETSRMLADAAVKRGAGFLDSPVAGSKKAAEDGQLLLMVGGEKSTLDKVKPILECFSRKIVHAGKAGMGSQLKLCFNLMVAHMGAALSEALILGVKGGLDPKIIMETINSGIIASKLYEWKGDCILKRDFSTNFSLKLMHKDLNLMMSSAYGLNVPLPVTAAVKELFGTAKSLCDPEQDFSSVIRALEEIAGIEVKESIEKREERG